MLEGQEVKFENNQAIEKALNIISGKWKAAILKELFKTKLRLKDIQKGLPTASKRTLTQQLKEMIDAQVIKKKDFNEYPKKTEYTIAPLGKKLFSVLNELEKFGKNL